MSTAGAVAVAEAQVEEAQAVARVAVVQVEAAQAAARVAVAQVEAVKAVEASADRRVHSEADWLRATRSRRRRNPPPGSALRVRTLRQEVLPVGCSPHINAYLLRRFLEERRQSAKAIGSDFPGR
jgi:hypothetical protein